ncbi:MAG TPA: ATP-dependent DNA helicase, partial [Acidimicrobiales bacterium]|nr:ATP-dependent DNA helicase [Acidimicrobiales bacterium]
MTTGMAGAGARTALQSLIDRLPGGETREGQLEMCAAVADALKTGEHLVVEAGTGVGKSLAYLVAAVRSGLRVVVATARKPLQDQLIRKDVPFVASAFPVEAAVLKGRSNYLCLAKLAEVASAAGVGDSQGRLLTETRTAALTRLAEWVAEPGAGDLADAPVPVDGGLRALVTVAAQECPGASQCRFGQDCLAERALERARSARLVVTNIDLYCLDLLIGGGLLGEHDAVVVDEAHELEAIASRILGLELGRRRFTWLAAQLRGLLVGEADEPARLDRVGDHLQAAFAELAGQRVDPTGPALSGVLAAADEALAGVTEVLRKIDDDDRRPRCLQAASSLLTDVRTARTPPAGQVAWVPEGTEAVLRLAPIDVGPTLALRMHAKRTTVLTSATLSVAGSLAPLAARLGLGPHKGPPSGNARLLRVSSPFDYRNQALL